MAHRTKEAAEVITVPQCAEIPSSEPRNASTYGTYPQEPQDMS